MTLYLTRFQCPPLSVWLFGCVLSLSIWQNGAPSHPARAALSCAGSCYRCAHARRGRVAVCNRSPILRNDHPCYIITCLQLARAGTGSLGERRGCVVYVTAVTCSGSWHELEPRGTQQPPAAFFGGPEPMHSGARQGQACVCDRWLSQPARAWRARICCSAPSRGMRVLH